MKNSASSSGKNWKARCKCCVEVGLKRFRAGAGFKTRKLEKHGREVRHMSMPNFDWDSLSESTQRICKRYEEHGLSEDVRCDLALAGGTEREFQTLQEAFNRVTHRTREPRSRALQLYKVMTSVIGSLEADVAEGDAGSGTVEMDSMMAEIPACKKTKTENEETARGNPALQQVEQASHMFCLRSGQNSKRNMICAVDCRSTGTRSAGKQTQAMHATDTWQDS